MSNEPTSATDPYRNLQARYERLMAISRRLNSTLDLSSLLMEILSAVTDLMHTETASIMLIDAETGELCFRASHDLGVAGEHEAFVVPREGSIAGWVVSNGDHQLVADVRQDKRFFGNVDEKVGSSTRDLLAVPLKAQDKIIGVVEALNKLAGESWTDDDIKTLSTLADQAAIAIQTAQLFQAELNRQRMEKELAIAQQIQLSLLPKRVPTVPGWEFAAVYQAARQVGGDFYDFFTIPGGPDHSAPLLGMVVADVADKGVPAALFMAVSRTVIRATAQANPSPSVVLEKANDLILQDAEASNLFVTVFYAALDVETGRLAYANGGHNPPLWWHAATGEITQLTASGMLLGIMGGVKLEERSIDLAPGDVIAFFTDGVTEAMNPRRDQFEEERLIETLRAYADGSAQETLDAIVAAVEIFEEGAEPSDDFTLFIVKRGV